MPLSPFLKTMYSETPTSYLESTLSVKAALSIVRNCESCDYS